MPEKFFVLGGGGHGRVVLDTLLASGVKVTGILDPSLGVDQRVFGIPVLGGNAYLDGLTPGDVALGNGIGANTSTELRAEVYRTLSSRGFVFEPIRHPTAIIGRDCIFGSGSQVMAGAVLQSGVTVAENVVVNTRSSVDHGCTLEMHCFVGPGAVLCGDVAVGRGAFIGAGAVVSPGVRIGEGAVVGAGAVVVRNVSGASTVVGNPAKEIGRNQ